MIHANNFACVNNYEDWGVTFIPTEFFERPPRKPPDKYNILGKLLILILVCDYYIHWKYLYNEDLQHRFEKTDISIAYNNITKFNNMMKHMFQMVKCPNIMIIICGDDNIIIYWKERWGDVEIYALSYFRYFRDVESHIDFRNSIFIHD